MSKKKALTLMFTALFVTIVCGLIWFILYGGGNSSNNSDSADATPKTTTSNSTKSAGDFISSEASLANFNKLLIASGEDAALKTTSTSFIVIAPNNEAFKNLPSGYFDSLLTSAKLSSAQDIAKYHIVTVTSDQLTAGQKLKTNEGQEIIVGKDGEMFTFTSAKGDTATALHAAYKTSNGSVYVVDDVMLPQ